MEIEMPAKSYVLTSSDYFRWGNEPRQLVPCGYLPSCCWGMPSGFDLRALCISLEVLNMFSVHGQRLMPLKAVGPGAAHKESVHIHPKTPVGKAPGYHMKIGIYFC